MIFTFTDFGASGPYLGQVKAVLHRLAPGVPVIDLVADAPAFEPKSAAYLLAALIRELPDGAVVLAVVDPGVGGERKPVVVEAGGCRLVGPDNGLFEPAIRQAAKPRAWEIVWRPERLSATFHGRDLFAPIAARLAAGRTPTEAGCRAMAPPRRADWPDDLPSVVYIDHYGNAMTGTRAATLPPDALVAIGGVRLRSARTYGEVPAGAPFWYENSIGLVEFAVNGGRADQALPIAVGTEFERVPS